MDTDIGCTCSADYDCDGIATVYKCELRLARKPYRCLECGQAIGKGDRYEWLRGLWDGEWETYRTCIGCARMRTDLFRGGVPMGCLRDEFMACFEFDYVTNESAYSEGE